MTDYEAAFWKLQNNWHESVKHYEERIEKLEAALEKIMDTDPDLAREAADRIEKLEAALRDLSDGYECCPVSRSMRSIARKALEGER